MQQIMFPELSGWRRPLVLLLFFTALFGIAISAVDEILSHALPSRFQHGDMVWIWLAVSAAATALLAGILKTFRFLKSLFAMSAAFLFMNIGLQCILGYQFPDARASAAMVGAGCLIAYVLLMKWSFRLMGPQSVTQSKE